MANATKKPAGSHKRSGGRGGPTGFAASIVHYRTGKRIYPKTAKAFPLFARRKPKDPCPEQLPLPLLSSPEDEVATPTDLAVVEAPAPATPPPPRRPARRTPRH